MIKNIINKLSIFKRKQMHQKISYSYGGCDLLINYIFKSQAKGFYVDVGCQHPISNNNTYLLYKSGWYGLNIDLDQKNIDLFNIERPTDKNVCIALSSSKEIKKLYFYHEGSPINTIEEKFSKYKNTKFKIKKIQTETLNNILNLSSIKEIDYLNIDVEGHEMEVLKGFDIKLFSPKVISVEYLDFSLNKLEFKNNILENVIKSDIYNYFLQNHYSLVNWTHADLIFVNDNFRD